MSRPPSSPLASALRAERTGVVAALAAGALVSLSTIGLTATSAWLIVRAAERPAVLSLTVLMGCVQLFALAKACGRYLERVTTHRVALRVMGRVRHHVATTLEPLLPAGLGPRTASAVDVAINDVSRVQDLLTAVAAPLCAALIAGLVTTVIVGAIAPLAGTIVLAGLLVCGVGVPALAARLGWRAQQRATRNDDELRRLVDVAVRAGDEIVAVGGREGLFDALDAAEDAADHAARVRGVHRGVIAGLNSLVTGATVIAVVLLTVRAVAAGSMSHTLVAVPALLTMTTLELVTALTPVVVAVRGDVIAATNLTALGRVEPPVHEPAQITHDVAVADTVRADGVSRQFDHHDVLVDATVELGPGDVVSVVGASGVGKSTLTLLLARLLEPSGGRLRLDDADYGELAGSQVRRRVGLVDDEPHVFSTTLRGNLLVAHPTASDEDVIQALENAGLAPFLRTLPDGLDTALGGGSIGVSTGERRRLGVARELLTRRPVAIFDEPTEGLDDVTATRLLQSLRAHYRHGAMLLITHRARDRDGSRCLEIRDGRLRESAS